MKVSMLITIAAVLLFAALTASGHDGVGGISLQPRPSARAMAMGETGLVPVGDGTDFMANPASLPLIAVPEISLGYGRLAEGVSASVASLSGVVPFGSAIAVPGTEEVGRRFGIGVCLDHSSVGLSQGTDWSWNLMSVGMGYRHAPYATAGLACKYVFSGSDLEGSRVQAFAADLGAFVELTPAIGLGLSVKNLLGSARWDDGENESPPLLFGLGAGFALPYGSSGVLAVTISNSDPGKGGLGVEVPIAKTGFSMRAGYLYHSGDYSRNVLTAGFGYEYTAFELDYAVKMDDELALGTTHHFSLGYMLR